MLSCYESSYLKFSIFFCQRVESWSLIIDIGMNLSLVLAKKHFMKGCQIINSLKNLLKGKKQSKQFTSTVEVN